MKRKVYYVVKETVVTLEDASVATKVTRLPSQFLALEHACNYAEQQPQDADSVYWVSFEWEDAEDESSDSVEASENLDTSPERRLEIYENLHDILSDMIEDGRLRREDFQQDYDAIVDLLQSPELAS
jgi:hypothetical protein